MDKKPKLYYAPAEKNTDAAVNTLRNILDHKAYHLFRSLYRKQLVGLHISYKQPSENRTQLYPFIKCAADSLKDKDVWAFICDTSDRYRNLTSNALEQIKDAWSPELLEKLKKDLPFFMLDGINGTYEYTYHFPRENTEAYLGGEVTNLDGLVVFSTPFEDNLCGIANSIFCLGAGLSSKRGKIRLYTMNRPQVNVSRCYACRRCLHECPVRAIHMKGDHVSINEGQCIDCGRCVEIAGRCGISYKWNSTPAYFQKRLLLQASAGMNLLRGKILFISVIPSESGSAELLISRDPVAVDAAVLEILKNRGAFEDKQLDAFRRVVSAAATAGIGSTDASRVEIAY